jgi:hypothetical protein
MIVVADFLCIAGTFVTGVYLIRDAIRRHDYSFVSDREYFVALLKGRAAGVPGTSTNGSLSRRGKLAAVRAQLISFTSLPTIDEVTRSE